MLTARVRGAGAVLCLLLAASLAFAGQDRTVTSETDDISAPSLINYQGKLTDGSGNPINGTRDLTFRIYNVATGGVAAWNETQTGVAIANGLFNVILGSGTPISNLPDGPDCYLEVVVGTTVIAPRIRLVSAPYALKSDDADKLDGQHASAFALSGHDHDSRYYTETELSSAGSGAQVHWSNLTGVPSLGTVTSISQGTGIALSPNPITTTGTVAFDQVWGDARYSQAGHAHSYVQSVGASAPLSSSGGQNPNISITGIVPVANGGTGRSSYTTNGILYASAPTTIAQTTPAGTGYLYWNGATYLWQTPSAGVGGSGSPNYVARWTGATTLGNSAIQDNGTNIAVGTGPSASHMAYTYTTLATVNADYGYNGYNGYANYGVLGPGYSNMGSRYIGVYGSSNASGGYGVYGYGSATTYGVWGAYSGTRYGYLGSATYGVYGENSVAGGYGVYGYGATCGVYGYTNGTASNAVRANNPTGVAVYADNNSGSYVTLYAYNANTGASNAARIQGTGASYPSLWCYNTNGPGLTVQGTGTSYYHTYLNAGGSSNPALLINGYMVATGSKSCVLKTSQGHELMFCVEAADVEFYANGTARLVNGSATVEFERLFQEAIAASRPVRVAVTPSGSWSGLYVAEKNGRGFKVRSESGDLNATFDWIAIGIRKGYETRPTLSETLRPSDEPAVQAMPGPGESGGQFH